MSIDAPGGNAEAGNILSPLEYERKRDDLWWQINRLKNPERLVRTGVFRVLKADMQGVESNPQHIYSDVIESVSPDIQIFTSSSYRNNDANFTMSVNGPAVRKIIEVNTSDLETAKKVHFALLKKFEEHKSISEALDWLAEESEFAKMKGEDGKVFLLFRN